MQLHKRRKPLTAAQKANQLLDMRDGIQKLLGTEKYRENIARLRPFVQPVFQKLGCPERTATCVLDELKKQNSEISADDLLVKRLITCAAIEEALAA